ncbi:hypothetical protein GCM10011392_38780 [Wenxinia marina]|uniref:Helix-turn-helix domain-containing protein n=1 Tax=Wenxinia marina DSM 24838 TaxID=1123501 RepID=A0A0D0QIA0_9RHOB|nr:hypothetical protein Wenmar_00637 [Wenxinia marina DSM 24838]GGL80416.1 hypothetical protein GCM10011392_38780 [Wenxinia marina]
MTRPALLPETTTPEDLAAHLGVAVRTLKDRAKEIGAYRKIGATWFFLPEDVAAIMEASRPCPSRSTDAAKSGTTAGPSLEGDYGDLRARLTAKGRSGSRRKPKPGNGAVISMDRARG